MLNDNFPHEAPMRDRFNQLCRLEKTTEVSIEYLAFVGFDILFDAARRGAFCGVPVPRQAILRTIYERDSDERVDEWDDHHAMMFKLRYGFDLYPDIDP